MWNKIKTFFSDLWGLQLASNEFMKHHWLGYIILILMICVPFWAIIAIHEYIEEKKDQELIASIIEKEEEE